MGENRNEIIAARVERSVAHAVFGGEWGRREFIARVGASTAAAALASVFPMEAAKARYHHGDNPNAATEPISDTELQGKVELTLELTGGA